MINKLMLKYIKNLKQSLEELQKLRQGKHYSEFYPDNNFNLESAPYLIQGGYIEIYRQRIHLLATDNKPARTIERQACRVTEKGKILESFLKFKGLIDLIPA